MLLFHWFWSICRIVIILCWVKLLSFLLFGFYSCFLGKQAGWSILVYSSWDLTWYHCCSDSSSESSNGKILFFLIHRIFCPWLLMWSQELYGCMLCWVWKSSFLTFMIFINKNQIFFGSPDRRKNKFLWWICVLSTGFSKRSIFSCLVCLFFVKDLFCSRTLCLFWMSYYMLQWLFWLFRLSCFLFWDWSNREFKMDWQIQVVLLLLKQTRRKLIHDLYLLEMWECNLMFFIENSFLKIYFK